jgi:hypothetical protein
VGSDRHGTALQGLGKLFQNFDIPNPAQPQTPFSVLFHGLSTGPNISALRKAYSAYWTRDQAIDTAQMIGAIMLKTTPILLFFLTVYASHLFRDDPSSLIRSLGQQQFYNNDSYAPAPLLV